MKLDDKQKIKLVWLVNQGKGGRFRATNPERFGFDDISWCYKLDGFDFTFSFRLFPESAEFAYIEFTPAQFCCHVPAILSRLDEELNDLLLSST